MEKDPAQEKFIEGVKSLQENNGVDINAPLNPESKNMYKDKPNFWGPTEAQKPDASNVLKGEPLQSPDKPLNPEEVKAKVESLMSAPGNTYDSREQRQQEQRTTLPATSVNPNFKNE